MLYDNALLVELMTLVWQQTRDPLLENRIAETVDWLFREMIAEGGGFAASLDADSEGEEGRFYVWRESEIDNVLGADSELFKAVYDISAEGNWEGNSIPNRLLSLKQRSESDETALADMRARLLKRRAKRIRPGWDDKVLTDWNGLMIAALAFAGMTFSRTDWIESAATAFRFVTESMSDGDRLYHSYRKGQARHTAYADGYANMIKAALNLSEATGDQTYLDQARRWSTVLRDDYWDEERGGLYYTAHDAEGLIARTRTAADDAIPNANAITLGNLGRLYAITGDPSFHSDANAILKGFSSDIKANLFGHAGLLNGFESLVDLVQIVIVGDPSEPRTTALVEEISGHSLPDRMIIYVPPGTTLPEQHPAAGKSQVDGKPTAYVCRGTSCSLPVTEPNRLSEVLGRAPLTAPGT